MDNNEKLKQAKENLKEIFKKDPVLKQAFIETINEMRKPENIKKMAKGISEVVNNVQTIKGCLKDKSR